MCAIIDACVATRVFVDKDDPELGLIQQHIFAGRLLVVYGGKLGREYLRLSMVSRKLRTLDQAGIARKMPDKAVDEKDKEVQTAGNCTSNDTHVIALALVSRARLLCSADHTLHTDFKNPKIIAKPRGRIYQNTTHNNLLKRKCKVCKLIG